jgi:dTDP-4-amino-4,6-dideoxygalactose transaminase
MNLPLLDLRAQHASLGGSLDAAIARVVAHGQFVQGPEVSRFEEAFALFCGARHCVGTSSGTSAIELALRAAGIGRGDEVVTTPFTFIASVAPIVQAGARPVLVDVDAATGLLQAETVEAALTQRTAAVLPVHLYGQTVDLDRFRSLADRHKLFLLEDAAQAHGAAWRGRRAGSIGDAATFSFFPGKNLGAFGDAGCVTTNDGALAARIRKLRDHGRADKYRHDELGINARLDTLQAAVLLAKLPHLDDWNERRRRHAAAYDEAFGLTPEVAPIHVREDALPVYHQYVVRLADRDHVREALRERGISTGLHYPVPIHRQPALDGVVTGSFPVAERLAREVISLPVFPELSSDQRGAVVAGVTVSAGAVLTPAQELRDEDRKRIGRVAGLRADEERLGDPRVRPAAPLELELAGD